MEVRPFDCWGHKIRDVILGCYTEDHLYACKHWLDYLLKHRRISFGVYGDLMKIVDITEVNIQRSHVTPKPATPPHILKRNSHLKVVPDS